LRKSRFNDTQCMEKLFQALSSPVPVIIRNTIFDFSRNNNNFSRSVKFKFIVFFKNFSRKNSQEEILGAVLANY